MDPVRKAWLAQRSQHRQMIRMQRARKFRVEVPVLLAELCSQPQAWGSAIWQYVEGFACERGAADLVAWGMGWAGTSAAILGIIFTTRKKPFRGRCRRRICATWAMKPPQPTTYQR